MIRRALEGDRDAVARIWKECFGDPDEYIRFFLSGAFRPSRCFLYEEGNGPAAMLHLFPMRYRSATESLPAQYLYAAATLPQYRRRGIMSRLVRFAVEEGKRQGMAFTALLPANDDLYGYYQTCGFETAFSIRRAQVTREFLEQFSAASPAAELMPEPDKMFSQRASVFTPALLWDEELFAYILAEWRFTGGEILAFDGGYCLCRQTGDTLFVKEFCVPPALVPQAVSLLLGRYESKSFRFHLPKGETVFPGEEIRYGMRGEGLNTDEKTYWNLLLD